MRSQLQVSRLLPRRGGRGAAGLSLMEAERTQRAIGRLPDGDRDAERQRRRFE